MSEDVKNSQCPTAVSINAAVERLRAGFQVVADKEKALKRTIATRTEELEATQEGEKAQLEEKLADAEATGQASIADQKARLSRRLERYERMVESGYSKQAGRLKEDCDRREDSARNKFQEVTWISTSAHEAAMTALTAERDEFEEHVSGFATRHQAAVQSSELVARAFALGDEENESAPAPQGADEPDAFTALLQQADEDLSDCESELASSREGTAVRMFMTVRLRILVFLTFVSAGAALLAMWQAKLPVLLLQIVGGVFALVALVLLIMYGLGKRRTRQQLATVDNVLASTVAQLDQLGSDIGTWFESEQKRLESERDAAIDEAKESSEQVVAAVSEARTEQQAALDAQRQRVTEKIRRFRVENEFRLERANRKVQDRIEKRAPAALEQLAVTHAEDLASLEERNAAEWANLEAEWANDIHQVYHALRTHAASADTYFPAWTDPCWGDWQPPEDFMAAVQLGAFSLNLAQPDFRRPRDAAFSLPGPDDVALPAMFSFPGDCSFLVESRGAGRDAALECLQTLMLRLLTACPAGKTNFTFIDPVGLGESFAGFMHLADFGDAFVGRRVWSEPRHIEQQLSDVNEHIEKVIQKYLRNEYDSIVDYNREAGEVAEPFRFVVIADFPVNFSETAIRRLASIANSGARCGVHLLLHWDKRHSFPHGFDLARLKQRSSYLRFESPECRWMNGPMGEVAVDVAASPPATLQSELLSRIGEAAKDALRVEVPFARVTPDELWQDSSRDVLSVAIGRAGARQLQALEFGRGTAQHALVAGKTGSGKSTLFHVMITNLALCYSPDELEFYLIDFKKGVEFKTYATARLPHLRAVAIESDREFGLSILHRIDEELKQRGDLFRGAGAQDLKSYRQQVPDAVVPRTLLIIDEFQEFFVEDDQVAQEAALLLDRLVRQGRAFGIHIILGSQTLGGAYALARSTMGQMAVRIALQCGEADSYLILNEDNAAARLLSRPGEAIYNDAAGLVEGNVPFQVVWLSDDEQQEALARVRKFADSANFKTYPPPIVFEGNAPGQIANNVVLAKHLTSSPCNIHRQHIWLGEPNRIRGHIDVSFERQSGNHLLIVGQNSEAAMASLGLSMLALGAQLRERDVTFYVIDGTPADDPQAGVLADVASHLTHDVRNVPVRHVVEAVNQLADELTARQEDERGAPLIFVVMHGLQRLRKLRYVEDYSYGMSGDEPPAPDKQLAALINDGPELGIHVLTWCDSFNSLGRMLERRTQAQFEFRMLFQMSANDSTALIDSSAASDLGLQHALYYNEQEGTLDKFRPYAPPTAEWLRSYTERLKTRDVAVS